MPNPFDHPALYTSIVLADTFSPGVVTLSGHDREIGWDVKKGPGQSGATTERTSEDPIKVKCDFYLVKDPGREIDDFAKWDDFLTLAKSTVSGAKPKALDIYHPDLARIQCRSVVLSTIGAVLRDGLGGETHSLTFLEYKPPKPKAGAPKGAKTTKEDPDAARLAELARLTAQYQETPWGPPRIPPPGVDLERA